MINKLAWDSELFGYSVGSVSSPTITLSKLSEIARNGGFKLVYIKSSPIDEKLGPDLTIDHKVIFKKELKPVDDVSQIKSIKGHLLNQELLQLAFLSGVFSRFKLDKNFKNNEFEKLYRIWIEKSLSGEIADEVFAYFDKDKILGFVSLKVKNEISRIGLIAVSEAAQGRGLGKLLIQKA